MFQQIQPESEQQEYHREYRHKENHKQKFKHDRLVLIRSNTIIGM